jgi:glycerol-3-phosphate dehydrogenase
MNRAELLERLEETRPWDILVIGGGATGLGAAVDAAARGYRALLLERHDFASGTSSRSTKLIHGGVRYLRQGALGLVREALHERERLMHNAPHLVHPLAFVIPVYAWWEGPYYAAGLTLYDLMAGQSGLEPSRRLSRDEVLRQLPTLEPAGLRGGILYHDGQFDDARLAISLVQTVFDLGGTALNYLEVTGFLKKEGRVAGVTARDAESGREYRIQARAVVNATGVFSDAVRRLDDASAPPVLAPSQGAHLVLDPTFLPGKSALLIPRTVDGRILFAIPWHGRVLIGTTDTPVTQVIAEPRALPEEIDYLLANIARYLSRNPAQQDILSVFAGLRPLVHPQNDRPSAMLSREHALFVSDSGVVSVAGGKWTTYRRMAQDAINRAASLAELEARGSATVNLRIHGSREDREPEPWDVYGTDAAELHTLAARLPHGNESLHPRLPYRACEVVWAVRHEFARTVEDVLARRTRALILDAAASMEMAPRVARLMANELNQDAEWQRRQVTDFRALAHGYLPE